MARQVREAALNMAADMEEIRKRIAEAAEFMGGGEQNGDYVGNSENDRGLKWQRKESPAVVGMLHDVCKMDDYVIQQEIVSVDQDGGPVYGQGQAVWNEDALWPGHGDKSLIMLMGHIELTVEEKLCIRYHMGAFTDSKEWKFYTEAVKKCPNVLYTHTADMIATKIKGV